MMPHLSRNTQAILLLTAPLLGGGNTTASPDLLSPFEYKQVARHLRDIQRQPADLVSPGADEVIASCSSAVDENRLQRLLARGFQLSQVIGRWAERAIWVISRADPEYPRRIKARLREDAPSVLYGCGDVTLLETGGLAIVGSRHVNDELIAYTDAAGRLAARGGRMVVSGGAKGVDQAAMVGALDEGGKACGVLADSLGRAVTSREYRNQILAGQLVLVSPYDPAAGFNVGHAMQRNKLIYALADVSLVVNADLGKGGTWAGAVEQLDKFRFVPVFVRSNGDASAGLDGLRKKGARLWPNPADADGLDAVIRADTVAAPEVTQADLDFGGAQGAAQAETTAQTRMVSLRETSMQYHALSTNLTPQAESRVMARSDMSHGVSHRAGTGDGISAGAMQQHSRPAETLFAAVQVVIQRVLGTPLKDEEVAARLEVSTAQAKAWLQRLVEDGKVTKLARPVRYVAAVQPALFRDDEGPERRSDGGDPPDAR